MSKKTIKAYIIGVERVSSPEHLELKLGYALPITYSNGQTTESMQQLKLQVTNADAKVYHVGRELEITVELK